MSPQPEISVIVPTCNGGWVLRRTIERLAAQDVAPDLYEIVVVDDGSTDGSVDGIEALADPVRLRVLRQTNRGRAAARNRGAAEARGRTLLFMDGDIWAEPGLIGAHLVHHTGADSPGVQGRTADHPDSLTTMFMRARNVIPDTTSRRRVGMSPYHVVTRNFSVGAEAFRRVGQFDEEFRGYGWEDMDLGVRLVRGGVTLRYDPAAFGHHYHPQTLEDVQEKMRQAGEGAVAFWRKHGRDWRMGVFLEILPVLLPFKWLVYRSGLFTAPLRPLLRFSERFDLVLIGLEIYNHFVWRAYYEGVFSAMRRGQGRSRA